MTRLVRCAPVPYPGPQRDFQDCPDLQFAARRFQIFFGASIGVVGAFWVLKRHLFLARPTQLQ